ncbi:sorting nexin-5 isoform X2 [Procambarus clarkii]|nr:sorting nexin-5-like isoform X2 [Procambarus clarkii]XP_045583084.1 sorting nexin-5-like isoform X2 [Procambarus clarkii]XP_045583085.1 sorting nexin-5-like isoform X2 [Procambarus clarkii]
MLEEGSLSGMSSGASTPEPQAPFTPKFSVRLSDRVTKDGDSVKFTLQVSQNGLTIQMLEREYEDFEYLDHCVTTSQPLHGLIIPPIPQRSAIDPYNAEIQSRRLMGKGSKTLIADEFHKDCHQLQKYLELLLSHPVLGKNEKLHDFLTTKDAPPRTKVKKGLISRLSDSLDSRKSSYPDSEEFFQKERDWVAKYQPAIANASDAFNKIIYAQLRIGHQLEHIVTALKLSSCPNDVVHNKQFNIINILFLECMDSIKSETDDKASKEDIMLGTVQTLWHRYIQAESAMLLDRTCLMVDYQSSNRALDKAKPNRKELAEKAKKEAEAAFEECSDIARHEIKHFQRQRVTEMQESVERYAAYQLTSARTTLSILSQALNQIKAINL